MFYRAAQRSLSMPGRAVSSRTPTDFHPSPVMGLGDCPLTNCHGPPGSPYGPPYPAVGMQRALASATGLPGDLSEPPGCSRY